MPYSDPEEQKAYQREYIQRRREEWFAENGPCRDCGSDGPLRLFHVTLGPLATHRIWTYSQKKREAELAHCIALCSPCWYKRPGAGSRLYEGINHGTLSAYKHYHCRCDPCRKANTVRVKLQRTRTPRKRAIA